MEDVLGAARKLDYLLIFRREVRKANRAHADVYIVLISMSLRSFETLRECRRHEHARRVPANKDVVVVKLITSPLFL